MCSSYPENIPKIIHMIAALRPRTVLDIGFGNGKYGFLIREYFYKRESGAKGTWPHVEIVDGIDYWEKYVKPHHKSIYDNIKIGNIFDFTIDEIGRYDLYLIVDVLEHWPKDKAHELLEQLTQRGHVLCSTPKFVDDQGETGGNKWEKHITQWTMGDFQRYKIVDDRSNESPSWLCLITKK